MQYRESKHLYTADGLIDCIMHDLLPVPGRAIDVDFGINGDPYIFGAYQWAYKHNITNFQELHAAVGNGEKLTEIINRKDKDNSPNPYGTGKEISTLWDNIPEEEYD